MGKTGRRMEVDRLEFDKHILALDQFARIHGAAFKADAHVLQLYQAHDRGHIATIHSMD